MGRLSTSFPKTEMIHTMTDFQIINSLKKRLNAKLKHPLKKGDDFS